MKKYQSIQVVRGILFLFILAFHCGVPYAGFGWGGVEAFFVISSFFLTKKFYDNEKAVDVIGQFKHRIKRLYPPYVIVLIIAALFAAIKRLVPFDIVSHLFSLQNFHWMITDYSSPMKPMTAHTWTLGIEVWGGLALLLLLRFVKKEHLKKFVIGMIIIGIAYRTITIMCKFDVYTVSLCPLAHIDAFGIGALLAMKAKSGTLNRKIGFLSLIGVVGIVICISIMAIHNNVTFIDGYNLLASSKNYLNHWMTGNIYLFISLLITGIIGMLLIKDKRNDSKTIRNKNVFVTIGDASYTLYLFHWPILVVLKVFVVNWAVLVIFTLVFTVIASYIFSKVYSVFKKRIEGLRNDSIV